ncbi:MAG: hypothetical protein ACLR8S_01490 [Paraprevotella clara]
MIFVSPAFGAGVPVTTGFKKLVFRTCKVGGKNTEALRGEDDFSTTPEGLDLACTKEHELPFACELRGLGYGMAYYPIRIIS